MFSLLFLALLFAGVRYFNVLYSSAIAQLAMLCRKINSSGVPGARLRRGYYQPANPAAAAEVDLKAEEADEYAGTTPVSHLVFAIHGIGQNLSGSNIAGMLLKSFLEIIITRIGCVAGGWTTMCACGRVCVSCSCACVERGLLYCNECIIGRAIPRSSGFRTVCRVRFPACVLRRLDGETQGIAQLSLLVSLLGGLTGV